MSSFCSPLAHRVSSIATVLSAFFVGVAGAVPATTALDETLRPMTFLDVQRNRQFYIGDEEETPQDETPTLDPTDSLAY